MPRTAKPRPGHVVADQFEHGGTTYHVTTARRVYVHFPMGRYCAGYPETRTPATRELVADGPTRRGVLEEFDRRRKTGS